MRWRSRWKSGHRRCDVSVSTKAQAAWELSPLARSATCRMNSVSGGMARSGCASSISRSSVVPERLAPTMKGAGVSGIAQLNEQIARNMLEPLTCLGVHLGPPEADPAGVRRPAGPGVLGAPLLRAHSAKTAAHVDVGDQLRQSLRSRRVVLEHAFAPGQLDELAHASQDAFCVADQVLVADLQIRADAGCLAARSLDPLTPLGSRFLDRSRTEPDVAQRQGDVSAITKDVDEARLGKQTLDGQHMFGIGRCLVPPARLTEARRVEAVEGAQRLAQLKRLSQLD